MFLYVGDDNLDFARKTHQRVAKGIMMGVSMNGDPRKPNVGKRYVLGYDFGTLSCRIIVCDLETGESVFEASAEYPRGVIADALPGSGARLGGDKRY